MIGETVGSYRVLSVIGKGGMGMVYLGEHALIGRRAAVKVLRSDASQDQESVTRFFNEARAAAKLRHPGLVDVYDFGHREDGSAFLVMEYLEGESLAELLARERVLALPVAAAITRQVASALQAAHEHNIVHRDLKPENVFLITDANAPGGLRAKVLDFGIAKLARVETDGSVSTVKGALYGTPRYIAPEQCKNAAAVDSRADVYALGCILFEMVLGRPPFTYTSWGELVGAHLHEPPPRPRDLDPDISPAIETVILTALAKNVDERYQTMDELALAAEAVWRTSVGAQEALLFTPPHGTPTIRPSTRPMIGSAPTLPVAAQITLPEQTEHPSEPSQPRSRLRVVGVIGVAIAVVATVIIALTGTSDDDVVVSAKPLAVPADAMTVQPVAADAAAVATPPATVKLVIDSIPRGAAVYRAADGIRLGTTPLERSFERMDGEADFVVKLAGYHDGRVSLATREDGSATAKLVRIQRDKRRVPKRHAPSSGPTMLDPYGAK